MRKKGALLLVADFKGVSAHILGGSNPLNPLEALSNGLTLAPPPPDKARKTTYWARIHPQLFSDSGRKISRTLLGVDDCGGEASCDLLERLYSFLGNDNQ